MSLIRWRRPSQMSRVLGDMDRLFNQVLRGPLSQYEGDEEDVFAYGPAVDLYETDDEVVVKAELPGVSRDDIDLTVQEDRLLLEGESKQEEEVDEEGYYRREIRTGSFRRAVPLPSAVDIDNINATFEDGVLTVRAPKITKQTEGTKVDIE